MPPTTNPDSGRLGVRAFCPSAVFKLVFDQVLTAFIAKHRKNMINMANEIATQNSTTGENGTRYSSLKGTDLATKKKIFTAITSASALAENLDKTINLKHVIIQPVTTEDEKGTVENFLRTILIDENNVAYASGSAGIVLAIKNLFDVYGEPDEWSEPVGIKVVEERGRRGYRYMTIKPADDVADEDEVKPTK